MGCGGSNLKFGQEGGLDSKSASPTKINRSLAEGGVENFFEGPESGTHETRELTTIPRGPHPIPSRHTPVVDAYPPHPLEYDVFLTHDWGRDEHNNDNHVRVGKLNKFLKKKGLVTWFDEDRMEGNILDKMSSGILNSALIVVCITQRYISKVDGRVSQNDNCRSEFLYARSHKTATRMIPVVMEKRMADSQSWVGPVGMTLGTELYKQLWAADDGSDSKFISDAEAIYQYIMERFANLGSGSKNSKVAVSLEKQRTLKDVIVNPKNHESPVEKEAQKVKERAVLGNRRAGSSKNLVSTKSQNSQNGSMDGDNLQSTKGSRSNSGNHLKSGVKKAAKEEKWADGVKQGSFKDKDKDKAKKGKRKLLRMSTHQSMEREALLARKLANPELELELKHSVDLLTFCVERGAEKAKELDGTEALILIGNTGAGKSTLANYLAGCEMVCRSAKDLGLKGLLNDVIVVKGTSDGGMLDELSPIGHSKISKTFMPNIFVAPPPGQLTFCDCPGFLDSRGAEINIANAVNIKMALGHAKGVRIIVLIGFDSLKADRGRGVKEMLQICGHLFGSEKNISKHKDSILLGITNAPPNMSRETIVAYLCEDAGRLLKDITQTLFLYDPLNRGFEDWYDRETLMKKIEGLTPIRDPAAIFQTVLTSSDESMLVALVQEFMRVVEEALSGKKFIEAAEAARQLGRLSVIEHVTVVRLFNHAHNVIRQYFTRAIDQIKTHCHFERFESAQQLLGELEEADDCFEGKFQPETIDEVRGYFKDSIVRYQERERREEERKESLARSQNLIEQMSEQLEQQQHSTRLQLQEQEDKFKILLATLEGRMEETLRDKEETERALKHELDERLKRKDQEIKTAAEEERANLQRERDSLRSDFEQKLKEAAEQNKKLLAQQEEAKRLMQEKHDASLEELQAKLVVLDEQQKQAKKDLEARSEEQKRLDEEAAKQRKAKEEEKAKTDANADATKKKKAKDKTKGKEEKPDSYQYPDTLKTGMRVARGKDWKWHEQDGGSGKLGTVTGKSTPGWFSVKWDANGASNNYRYMPKDSIYDLKLASIEPSSDEAGLVLCPKGHKTSDHQKSAAKSWVCDVCSREHGVGPCANMRRCESCDWDACVTCSKRLLDALVTSEQCKAGNSRFLVRITLHEDKITARISLSSNMKEELGKLGRVCSIDSSDPKLSVKVKHLSSGKEYWWSYESLEKPAGVGSLLRRGGLLKVLDDQDLVQESMKGISSLKWSSDLKKYLGKVGTIWRPVLGDSACVTLRMHDEAEVEWPLSCVEAVSGRTYMKMEKGTYYRVKDNIEAVKVGCTEMCDYVRKMADRDEEVEIPQDQITKYAGTAGRCVMADPPLMELKHFDGTKHMWSVGCLEEIDALADRLNVGDKVRLIRSEKQAKKLLHNNGGWVDPMKRQLGKTGVVKEKLASGRIDIKVGKDSSSWRWPYTCVDIIKEGQSLDDGTSTQFGMSKSTVKVGMMLRVVSNLDAAKAGCKEAGDVLWSDGMEKYTGWAGRVQTRDDVSVKLRHHDGKTLWWGYGSVEKVDELQHRIKVGDTVRITPRYNLAKKQQVGFGGWNENMKKHLGKLAKASWVSDDGAKLNVEGGGSDYYWNYSSMDTGKDLKALDLNSSDSDYEDEREESGMSKSTVKVGMMLRVVSNLDAAKAGCKEASGVGWSDGMEKYTGWAGRVQTRDDVSVKLRHHDGETWWWGYGSVEKVDELQHRIKVGDTVRITPRYNLAKKQQVGFGGWNEDMKKHLGKLAKAQRVCDDKAFLDVEGGGSVFVWNYSSMDTGKDLKALELNSSDSDYEVELEADDDSDSDSDSDGHEDDDSNDVCVDGSKSKEGKDVWRYAALKDGDGDLCFGFTNKELNISAYFLGRNNGWFEMEYPKDGKVQFCTVWSKGNYTDGELHVGSDRFAAQLKKALGENPTHYLQADRKRVKQWKIRWSDGCWFIHNIGDGRKRSIVLAPNAFLHLTEDTARIVDKSQNRTVSRKEGKALIPSGDTVSDTSAFSDASSDSSDADGHEDDDSDDVCVDGSKSQEGKDVWRFNALKDGDGDPCFVFRNTELNISAYFVGMSNGWFEMEYPKDGKEQFCTFWNSSHYTDGEVTKLAERLKKALGENPTHYLQVERKRVKQWKIRWSDGCWFIHNNGAVSKQCIVLAPNALLYFSSDEARIMDKLQNRTVSRKEGKALIPSGDDVSELSAFSDASSDSSDADANSDSSDAESF